MLSEVKHVRARLVLWWGTTLESRVLFFLFFCRSRSFFIVWLAFLSLVLSFCRKGEGGKEDREIQVQYEYATYGEIR